MRRLSIFIFLLTVVFCTSCNKNKSNLAAIKFGEVKKYSPSFGSDPYQKILTVPVELQFNKHAIEKDSYVELEWVNENGVKPRDFTFYVNETKMLDNSIRFNARDFNSSKQVKLGLLFNEGAGEGKYKGYLKVKKSDLDRIDNADLLSQSNPEIFRWQAKFTETLHPIIKGIIAALIAIVSFHILWFLLAKPLFYPSFKRGEFEVLEPSYNTIKLKGYKQFHLGGKQKVRQGFISKFYTGKIGQAMREYDFNITLKPFRRRGNIWCRIKADADVDVDPRRGTIYNFNELDIKTAAKDKIKLVYKNSKNNKRA